LRAIFRTDAGTEVGTGHLMRCLALAAGLRAEGAECAFLCRDGLGALAQVITDGGHRLIRMGNTDQRQGAAVGEPLAHDGWLPGGWQQDLDVCLGELASEPAADWLVVDHYALDRRWEQGMRATARSIMAIDDLADRVHDCDLLLDQNLMPAMDSRYAGLLPSGCKSLLGPRYALLRSEFSGKGESTRGGDHPEPRLLVMFGGADAGNLTLRTVKTLADIGWNGPVDVVAGPLYPAFVALQAAIKILPDATLHAPALDVAALMHGADLAVGSPGLASLERCACALPSLTISQAKNQEEVGVALAEAGAHWYLGRAEAVTDEELQQALCVLRRNVFGRKAMSAAAAPLCDGQGVKRVIRQMLATTLAVRPVRAEDTALLFGWRNDERTRRQSFDPRALDPIGHADWLMKVICDEDRSLLLVSRAARDVACVRFDCAAERATVSIYLDPALHGCGIGVPALMAAIDWLREARPEVRLIEADVLAGNVASQALFASVGFAPARVRYELHLASSGVRADRNQSRQMLT
jgi:UDP-2,4-diacetamido-2,4,6-trideoxy-beta-L-altropyranose hydrolase